MRIDLNACLESFSWDKSLLVLFPVYHSEVYMLIARVDVTTLPIVGWRSAAERVTRLASRPFIISLNNPLIEHRERTA